MLCNFEILVKYIFVCLDLFAVAITIPDYRVHYGKNYTIVQDSKKFDCPAKIRLREIVEFPSYKVCLSATNNPTICCLPVF